MSSYKRATEKPPVARVGGACFQQPQHFSLRGRSLAVVVGDFPETPHWTRDNTDFPRPMRHSDARLCLACPPPARRASAPHERGVGGGSDPPFLSAGVARDEVNRRRRWRTINPRLGDSPPLVERWGSVPDGVAPSTVIPAGRLSSRPRSRQRKTADHNGPQAERGKPGGCTQPDISDPQHGQLATPLDGLGLRVDTRLTCPSRS